jgi:hypothetical protein
MDNLTNQELDYLHHRISVGITASDVSSSEQWKWISENLLGALNDRALITLKNAKTEEDRMKAQQMYLASQEPKEVLDRLIQDGRLAAKALQEISNP